MNPISPFSSGDPSGVKTSRPSRQRLPEMMLQRLPGLMAGYPFDLMANVCMQQAFKVPSNGFAQTTRDVACMVSQRIMTVGPASLIEYAIHRGGKVMISLSMQDQLTGRSQAEKLMLKPLAVFLFELLISPSHALMIRSTTGGKTLKEASRSLFYHPNQGFSFLHPWRGAVKFGSKGLTFSAGQFMAWDFCEKVMGGPLKDMTTSQQAVTFGCGATLGSLTSMISTRYFYNSAMNMPSPSLQSSGREWGVFLRSAFVPMAVTHKAFWKSAAHILMHIR